MGVVFEAVHVIRGNRVALKLLPQVDGARLYRFKREFRSAADISHPNLIGLHSLESDGAQWFFTMDLVEGVDFLEYVRPGGRLDETRLRSALSQLVMGVMALHGHHIIHRDLKPSNVMVTPERPGRPAGFRPGGRARTAGAAAEHRPDRGHAGLHGPRAGGRAERDARQRLVCRGVMLYEALCGRRPFDGSILGDPAGQADLDAAAAHGRRRHARRPGRALHAAAGARARPAAGRLEIAKMVASGLEPVPAAATGPGGHHLVGREPQLAALDGRLRARSQRRARTADGFHQRPFGRGQDDPGRALPRALRETSDRSVMAGRCYDRESVPIQGAWTRLIDALASLPAGPARDRRSPADARRHRACWPACSRCSSASRSSPGQRAAGSRRSMSSRSASGRSGPCARLLVRISRRSPVVWFIDDLQWGDADSAEALFETLRPPDAPAVLFLGTYRSDEAEGSPFLKMWKELSASTTCSFADREVKLAPLTVEECTELVIDLLGQDNEGIRRRAVEFARETRGNPFLLIELVGCFDPETDSFEPLPLHEVLDRKLGRLPGEAGHLLEVVAVSGQALSARRGIADGGPSSPPVATITRMRNERLVRMVGPEDSPLVDTYHDRVRETVLGRHGRRHLQDHPRHAGGGHRDIGGRGHRRASGSRDRTGRQPVEPPGRCSRGSTTWRTISTPPATGTRPGPMPCWPREQARDDSRPWKSPPTTSRSPTATSKRTA